MVVKTINKKTNTKTAHLFFVIFKKTKPSKPKISQIKIYLQETLKMKIFFLFLDLKQMAELYVS